MTVERAAEVMRAWAADLEALRPFVGGSVKDADDAWALAMERFRQACRDYAQACRDCLGPR